MAWQYTEFVWPFLVAFLVSATLVLYAWRRRTVRSAWPFLAMIALGALWSLLSSMQAMAVGLEAKALLSRLRYVPIATLPVAWLVFALTYTGRRHWLTAGRLPALLALPVLTLLVVATNTHHGLMFTATTLSTSGPLASVANLYGPWFWVHTAYSYVLLAAGVLILAAYRLYAPALYRKQATLMLVGAVTPFLLNVLYLASPGRFGHIDWTPVAFTVSGVFFAWGLFRFHLLDLMPVARAAIVESLLDAVIVLDVHHRVVDLNPVAQRLFGLETASAVGQPLQVLTQGTDLPWPTAELAEGQTDEITLVIEGERRLFACSRSPLHEHQRRPEHQLLVVVLRDVTERRRSARLETGQRRILEMIASGHPLPEMLDAIVHLVEALSPTDMLCSILLLNEDGLHLRHGAAPSLPASYTQAIDGIAIGPEVGSCGTAAFRGERIVATDLATDPRWTAYRGLALDHGLRACWSTPIFSSEGAVLGTFAVYYPQPAAPHPADEGIINTATSMVSIAVEQRRFEDALIHAKDRAEEMARLKSSFLANMSHEIRTPLTSIIGFSDILSSTLGAEHQDLVAQIAKGGRRLLETLNSVLDYARLEAGRVEMHTTVLDVTEVAEEAIAFFLHRARAKKLTLALRQHTPKAVAELDPALLTRVLSNLIDNALKFTDTGGILLHVDADAERIYLRVEDTGEGISETFLPHLFEEFQQESSGMSRSHQGSGLGLRITKRIVEQMHGAISVESRKGDGSTFTVSFPAYQPTSLPADPRRPHAAERMPFSRNVSPGPLPSK